MVRPGEKTDGYRAEAVRVRQEAESVRHQLLNTSLELSPRTTTNSPELRRCLSVFETNSRRIAAAQRGTASA
jgi:hypothetical protein